MNFHITGQNQAIDPVSVGLRCSACGNLGTFVGFANCKDIGWTGNGFVRQAGLRKCPNPDCRAVAFVVQDAGVLVERYPPETLDFDSTNLPDSILHSLEEAISCFSARAYKATALMVRRTLEELCADRNASGKDLKARLSNLGDSVVVPKELLEAADELRLLGNDAAHIEAKSYDNIGREEAELAIELAKELLKAVYQYADLVARLRALKKNGED
jgi:HEPN domain-containing protein